MLCTANPSLRLASDNAEVLRLASRLSRIKVRPAVAHTGWSALSYYCKGIVETLAHLQRELQDAIHAQTVVNYARVQQLQQQIALVMGQICIPGQGCWSQLRHRRLIPIAAVYAAHGLHATRNPRPQIFRPAKAAAPKAVEGAAPIAAPAPCACASRTILRQLRALQSQQAQLSEQLERMRDAAQLIGRYQKKKKEADVEAALQRGLSMPQRPAGIPAQARFPEYARPTGRLTMPDVPPPYAPKAAAPPPPARAPTPRETLPPQVPSYPGGPSLGWVPEAPPPPPPPVEKGDDPLSRFLRKLLQETGREERSPSPSRRRRRRRREEEVSPSPSPPRRIRKKTEPRIRKEEEPREKGPSGAKKEKKRREEEESPREEQEEQRRPPSIHAFGGLRIDADGQPREPYYGAPPRPPPPLSPTLYRQGVPTPYPGGAGGVSPPPPGGMPGAYYPHPSMVPVKPTIEGHLAPAGAAPYATFRYPSPPREPKPIVVHLHQHKPGVPTTTLTRDHPVRVEESPKTSESTHAAIATAAGIQATVPEAAPPKAAPPSPPPWPPYPYPMLAISPPVAPGASQPSPSHLQLGFEGAVDLDPALLPCKRRPSRARPSPREEARRRRRRRAKKEERLLSPEETESELSSTEEEEEELERRRRRRRRLLIPKLLQQLYYFPETIDQVAERDLQEILPLLQPFEARKLQQALDAYHRARGIPRAEAAPVPPEPVGPGAREAGPVTREGGPQAIALGYARSETGPSLEAMRTGSLLDQIRETEAVTREHYGAVLRGEARGAVERDQALEREELKKALRHLETKELLEELRQAPDVRAQRRVFIEEPVERRDREGIPAYPERVHETLDTLDASIRLGESASAALTASREEARGRYPGLARLDERPRDAKRRELEATLTAARLLRNATVASTGLPRDTQEVERLHTQAQDIQDAMNQLIGDLQREPSSSPRHLQVPAISVSPASPPDVPSDTSTPPTEEVSPRTKPLLQVPKLAAAEPEDRIRADARGQATIEGDLSLLQEISRMAHPMREPQQPAVTIAYGVPVGPPPPAAFGYPEGGVPPAAAPPPKEAEEQAAPTYIAEIRVPKEEEAQPPTYVPRVHLPPPHREKLPPDAGSPLPLSSLLWGGAEGSPATQGRHQLPTTEAHFQEIRRPEAETKPRDRFEQPIRDWETMGLMAGAEDVPRDQVVWRSKLRPYLDKPWRERVQSTFIEMQQYQRLERRASSQEALERPARVSQVRDVLKTQRQLKEFELTGAQEMRTAWIAPEPPIRLTSEQDASQDLESSKSHPISPDRMTAAGTSPQPSARTQQRSANQVGSWPDHPGWSAEQRGTGMTDSGNARDEPNPHQLAASLPSFGADSEAQSNSHPNHVSIHGMNPSPASGSPVQPCGPLAPCDVAMMTEQNHPSGCARGVPEFRKSSAGVDTIHSPTPVDASSCSTSDHNGRNVLLPPPRHGCPNLEPQAAKGCLSPQPYYVVHAAHLPMTPTWRRTCALRRVSTGSSRSRGRSPSVSPPPRYFRRRRRISPAARRPGVTA